MNWISFTLGFGAGIAITIGAVLYMRRKMLGRLVAMTTGIGDMIEEMEDEEWDTN